MEAMGYQDFVDADFVAAILAMTDEEIGYVAEELALVYQETSGDHAAVIALRDHEDYGAGMNTEDWSKAVRLAHDQYHGV
jgi:hypothetical protein